MNKLSAILGVCILATACSGGSNNTDSGNNTTDSGQMVTDSGNNNPVDAGGTDAGPIDAGPNCDGGGCYACPPTTYVQIVNACTNAQSVSKMPTGLPLLPDGGLPALP